MLKAFGRLLMAGLRGSDAACRYGGEEFALLLPGRNLEQAARVAERLRKQAAESIKLPDGRNVTIRAGCSEYQPGEDSADFLKRADDALY